MGSQQIIALDLGKYKSVACVMDAATRRHEFATVDTTPAALHEFLAGRAGAEPSRALVVLEACDCAGWVHDLAAALGCRVTVANGNHEAWRWRRVKRKTDRDDALRLAKMALLEQLPAVHVPAPEQRQRRHLVLQRRSLVQRRTACKNAVRAVFSQQGLTERLPRGKRAWSQAAVAQLRREHARPLAECGVGELWRGRLSVELDLLDALDAQVRLVEARLDELAEADARTRLLQTVPGVGPRLAEAVVVCLDDPRRFRSGAEVGGYAGLVPKLIESGTMSRVGRCTRRGPTLLRGMLVEVAWVVWRHNAWAKAFVEKVSRGMTSRRKVAVVALARRLLVRLWAMLRTGRPWRDPCEAAAAAAVT
jgi:transposase